MMLPKHEDLSWKTLKGETCRGGPLNVLMMKAGAGTS